MMTVSSASRKTTRKTGTEKTSFVMVMPIDEHLHTPVRRWERKAETRKSSTGKRG